MSERTGWVGWIYFAAVMMILSGVLNTIYGLIAIVNPNWEAFDGPFMLFFDIAGWGWLHLIIGVIVLIAGIAVFSGSDAARVIMVILACLSIVANFFWMPVFPWWSILIIVLDVFVIWAVIGHGSELDS